tara:strand:+ start:928 stop:1092 length:165 start_codon:yes stop_codon:yes gene_type:complete
MSKKLFTEAKRVEAKIEPLGWSFDLRGIKGRIKDIQIGYDCDGAHAIVTSEVEK